MEPRGSLSESRSGRGTRVREAGGFSCGQLGLRLLPAQGMLLACEDLHARGATPSSFLWLLLRGMVEEEGEELDLGNHVDDDKQMAAGSFSHEAWCQPCPPHSAWS